MPNKALHPTAYSFVRSSLRFRRRVSLVVNVQRVSHQRRRYAVLIAREG